ncbi:MAG: SpoVG family protein [Candidatus Omnitrophica bacterium]|nr:SpoVG family protein [Candidatus Omnitrophota bacterium]MCA9428163.1 SpoVG family protein [Candidatus Omnitrophota bacterium]MCA9434055.1 SpoVG family protein [Candidatus Omnitrophota bacterium]MCA9437165.1 SpoVG family protein [Candidatus Omnitrophota bacterium]MCA9440501.1 SpoVG family protein [Candidatus Omnitrophota bacterium]
MLNITEVRIHMVETNRSNLRAYGSITIDDCFVIHGLKILQGDSGLFVGMPRRHRDGGEPQDIAHPLDIDTRKHIESMVLDAYAEIVAQTQVQ